MNEAKYFVKTGLVLAENLLMSSSVRKLSRTSMTSPCSPGVMLVPRLEAFQDKTNCIMENAVRHGIACKILYNTKLGKFGLYSGSLRKSFSLIL